MHLRPIGKVGFGKNDRRRDSFDFGESEELIEVTKRGAGFASAVTVTSKSTFAAIVLARPPALRRSSVEAARFHAFDESLSVFENAYLDDVARHGHEAISRHPPELCDSQIALSVNRDPGGILPRRDDQRPMSLALHARLHCCKRLTMKRTWFI